MDAEVDVKVGEGGVLNRNSVNNYLSSPPKWRG